MTNSLILIEGRNVTEESLNLSLSNAKHLVVGRVPMFGVILSVSANTSIDHGNALLKFSQVKGVTKVATLLIKP